MSEKNKGSLPDVLAVLRDAQNQNDADMKADGSVPAPTPDATIIAPEEPGKKRTKVTKRINAETAELIDQYSERREEPKLSDTQKLRAKLADRAENAELLGYLGEEKPGRSERVEKLYDMINDAKTRTLSDAEKQPPSGFAENRFSDSSAAAEEGEYSQEQMFPLGDTLNFADKNSEKTTRYDEDYASLTERVSGKELDFDDGEAEGQIKLVPDEGSLDVYGGDLDETDINLRLAFEMMKDEDGSLKKLADKSREKLRRERRMRSSEQAVEYTDRSRNSVVGGELRKKKHTAFARIIVVALLMLGILFLELATKDSSLHPDFTKQGRYGILYILIDLQMLFFIALALIGHIRSGLRGIFSLRLNADSLLVMSVLASAAYSLVVIFTDPQAGDLKLYNLPAAFAGFCSAVSAYLAARRDYHCFRILASKRPKYVASPLSGGTREADEFYKYLFEDSEIYTVKRAGFVEGFSERTQKRSGFEDSFNFLLPVILVVGAALFGVMKFFGSATSTAYCAFSVLIAASVPATGFFMVVLPTVFANRVGAKHSTAFIGNTVAEEYASASVISFADTEVYPASLVKITNIRLYGENRIDEILTGLSKVFSYVGGPLAKVLSSTVPEDAEAPKLIRVIESASDGLCVAMDGRNYFLGKRSYMKRYRFECPVDDGDDEYDKSVGSVMYVVIDEGLAAKLYIRYTVNPLFDSLLKDMYKAGLCLGIKTLDPNINNDLLSMGIKFRKCPISVLRGVSPDDVAAEVERADSGIACNSTLHNFLKMFSVCDKVRNVTKFNVVISVISVFMSFILVSFLAVSGDISAINSLYAVAFQLFWMLPVWLVSFFAI